MSTIWQTPWCSPPRATCLATRSSTSPRRITWAAGLGGFRARALRGPDRGKDTPPPRRLLRHLDRESQAHARLRSQTLLARLPRRRWTPETGRRGPVRRLTYQTTLFRRAPCLPPDLLRGLDYGTELVLLVFDAYGVSFNGGGEATLWAQGQALQRDESGRLAKTGLQL